MRVMRLVLTLAVAAPSIAWSQPTPEPAGQGSPATLETMRSNVSRISASLEHDRWSANISLWEARLAHSGKIEGAVIAGMRDSLSAIANIVAQIHNPDEKERWQANHDLWSDLLGAAGTPSRATVATMRTLMTEMQANVGRITAPGEKERWQANCDLWKATIGPR